MNPLMWNNAATRRNVAQLERDGVAMIGPNAGEMAEANEAGVGRMAEPLGDRRRRRDACCAPPQPRPLAGKRVLITSGPDARADRSGALHRQPLLRQAGPRHCRRGRGAPAPMSRLISGPVDLPDPARRNREARRVRARHAAAVEASLPADIAIFAAAVADWRVANAGEQKLKKTAAGMPPLQLVENPDILATISKLKATSARRW